MTIHDQPSDLARIGAASWLWLPSQGS